MLGEWQVWTGIIPASVCDNYVRRLLELPDMDANVGDSSINYEVRRSKIAFLPLDETVSDIRNLILDYTSRANRDYFGFDITYGVRDIQFTKYHSDNKGFYGWHHDVFFTQKEPYHRKLSFILQLTDHSDYKGGDFEFRDVENIPPRLYKPKGSIIVFPSYQYHRVMPVTEGTRYSLVSWIDGPRWR